MSNTDTGINWKPMAKGLGVLGTLAAVGFLLNETGFSEALNTGWIDTEVKGQGLRGEAIFVAAAAIFTALGLPRQVIAFLSGYAFGLIIGVPLAVLGTALGCAITFFWARLFGRSLVRRHFPQKIKHVDDFLSENTFSMTLLIRLLPVGSNLATNMAAGVSGVKWYSFISASAVGYVPQTLIFALVGSGINLDPAFRISLGAALFVVSGLIGVWLYRKYRHGKSIDEEIDQELHIEDPERPRP